MPKHVIVTAYNPEWKEMFEAEALLIQDILGDNCVAVHHIGSTAVNSAYQEGAILEKADRSGRIKSTSLNRPIPERSKGILLCVII